MFSTTAEATLAPGESMDIRGYTLTFNGLETTSSSDSAKVTGTLDVARGDKRIGTIESSKRLEGRAQELVTDVGIRSTPREDLYVILSGLTDDLSEATFKVFVNPLMMWIWVGGGVLVAGTLIAFWPDVREESRVPVRRLLPVGEVETGRA
jgi:cytochrome c-type biogenesis protein CcmF